MTLDLSATTFVDPFGMVTLIGLCRHMHNLHGISSTIVLPEGDAGSYMERAGFNQTSLIDNFIAVERKKNLLKQYFRKNNNNMGVLWFFESERDIQTINGEIESWMAGNDFSEEEINSITTFISEMVQNVCQHSNTPQKGVLCFQAYTTKKGESFLSWAISDAGIGIRQSLIDSGVQDIVGYNDERVIREVIMNGISRFQDDKTRGNGLSRLYKAAQKRRAVLYIHSHAGLFGLNIDLNQLKKLERKVPLVTGTHIGFHLSRT
jgi:anti-sigma regulatory factor (Ser/Thr protein kinase)